jgi:uncharacterized membrane protein
MTALAVGLLSYEIARQMGVGNTGTRFLLSWNIAVFLYLAAVLQMMLSSSAEDMRRRAVAQNHGEWVIMITAILGSFICLAAIVSELGEAKKIEGGMRYLHLAHTGFALVLSWIFTQVMFAQQYAHDYYGALEQGEPGGLQFPEESSPDYLDFLYMACVIGATGQTADISFTGKNMRRIGLLHGLLSFFFNATVLALTVNMASSLI